MAFRIEAFQNRNLAPGKTRVDAIVSVSADPALRGGGDLVVGFILDKSGSMINGRVEAVKHAVVKAVQMLADGTWFFVVAFDGSAYVVVRETKATPETKRWAAAQLDQIQASGGTAMSAGLRAARTIFERAPNAIRRAVFLTDGKNEGEKASAVDAEIARCAGLFECDCWGVGTDWKVGEVQAIAGALLGRASLIPSPEGVEGAFRDAVERASSKALKDVRLRLWTPQGARILFVKQVNPTIEDLTPRGRDVSPQIREYHTGSWGGGEARDFHVAIEVRPGEVGDEMLAARPSVAYLQASGGGWEEHEDKSRDARVLAVWTADASLSSRADDHVAEYIAQGELAAVIEQGLDAHEKGRDAEATHLLGRAVRLAHGVQNAAMTQRLARVVDVIDASRGTVRLKRDVKRAATMELQLESRTTRRVAKPPAEGS